MKRRLLALTPGETHEGGKPPYTGNTGGKNGSPAGCTAGTPFTVTALACDYWWNINTSFNPNVNLTDNDPNAAYPAPQPLVNGTTTFTQFFVTRNDTGWSVSVNGLGYVGYDTPNLVVAPNIATKLLALLPGQSEAWGTYASTQPGRSGMPADMAAGTPVQITLRSCDDYYNFQSVDNSLISIAATDPNMSIPANRNLSNGVTFYTIIPVTAGTQTITVSDMQAPFMASNRSDVYHVNTGPVSRLQVLVPGETSLPGSASGKQGTVAVQTAGIPFNVTVNATDLFWNIKLDHNDAVGARLDTTDPWDINPSTQPLTNGTTIFAVTLVTRGAAHKLYAVDAGAYALEKDTSSIITVIPKIDQLAELKLQLVVPGETAVEGKWNNGVNPVPYGKSGLPSVETAGVNFTVTVNMVDKFWNVINSGVAMQYVQLMNVNKCDPFAVYPGSTSLTNRYHHVHGATADQRLWR